MFIYLYMVFFQAALVAIKKINRSFTVTKPLLMQFKKVRITCYKLRRARQSSYREA